MQVIIIAENKKLGKLGEIKKVSNGYARNYLLPQKLVVLATPENIKIWENKKKKFLKDEQVKIENLKKIKDKLINNPLTIKAKAGENGRLFGTVTTAEIVENIKNVFNEDLDKKCFDIINPIKSIGSHKINAKLSSGIEFEFEINIEAL